MNTFLKKLLLYSCVANIALHLTPLNAGMWDWLKTKPRREYSSYRYVKGWHDPQYRSDIDAIFSLPPGEARRKPLNTAVNILFTEQHISNKLNGHIIFLGWSLIFATIAGYCYCDKYIRQLKTKYALAQILKERKKVQNTIVATRVINKKQKSLPPELIDHTLDILLGTDHQSPEKQKRYQSPRHKKMLNMIDNNRPDSEKDANNRLIAKVFFGTTIIAASMTWLLFKLDSQQDALIITQLNKQKAELDILLAPYRP